MLESQSSPKNKTKQNLPRVTLTKSHYERPKLLYYKSKLENFHDQENGCIFPTLETSFCSLSKLVAFRQQVVTAQPHFLPQTPSSVWMVISQIDGEHGFCSIAPEREKLWSPISWKLCFYGKTKLAFESARSPILPDTLTQCTIPNNR